MKNILKLIFIVPLFSFSQGQGNQWYFGDHSALDFNSGSPVPVIGCQIAPLPQGGGWNLNNEGCASIADNNGNLLFYSEGQHVWNRYNQLMPNGSNLLGCYSSTTAAFIIPVPLSDSLFYLFTTDCLENNLANGLRYSMIDMCLDGGKGDVIPNMKNILLLDTASEKITAVNHSNGSDYWMIAHKHYSDTFYTFQISSTGIASTVITSIGSVYGPSAWQAIGQMKASPDGRKIISVIGNGNVSIAELLDFNDTTGVISNLISLTNIFLPYSADFSPNSSKLYTWGLDGVSQYDLISGTQAGINASKVQVSTEVCMPCGMQLAPDNKIYFANTSAIIYPDLQGLACSYVQNVLTIGASAVFPSFINSFRYNNHQTTCSVIANFMTTNNICSGDCIDFTNLSVNATSYQWHFQGATPDTSTAFDPTNICYANAGSYNVQLIANSANGNDTLLLSNYITVYPQPPPQGITQNGDTLFAIAGVNTYQWYYNSAIIIGATNSFYVAQASGDYNVVATDAHGCEVEAAIFDVHIGIEEMKQWQVIQVYPNPVEKELIIEIEELEFGTAVEISIYNVLGENVFQTTSKQFKLTQTIDVSSIPSGIYWVEILSADKTFRSKFVKQ